MDTGDYTRQHLLVSSLESVCQQINYPTIRASIDWLADYSISGVHRVLKRCGLCIRSGRVQQYSPDPAYEEKLARLLDCLRQAVLAPTQKHSIVPKHLCRRGF